MTLDGLAIGELADRTGVGISTLRAWERRYGFPVPDRAASGHRRYRERDVRAVLEVLRERAAGSALEPALARARERATAPRSSLFATMRHVVPEVPPALLSTRGMLGISRAIEDEAAARTERALVVGAFQEPRSWRAARARWRDVAARADLAVAIGGVRRTARRGVLWELPLPAGDPMEREWAVLCDDPSFSACLVGVERPGRPATHGGRRFEALWTVEPLTVREVARAAARIAVNAVPELAEPFERRFREPAITTYDSIRDATLLANRALAYVDR